MQTAHGSEGPPETATSEWSALGRVAQALVREPTPERVGAVAVEEAQRVLGLGAVAVWVLEPDGQALRLLAERGFGPASTEDIRRIPLDSASAVATAVRTGQPLEVADLWAVGPELSFARRVAERDGLRSVLSQPLLARGRVVGAMNFVPAERDTPHTFTPHERSIMRVFSDLCTAAIENAWRAEALRESEDRFRILSDAAFEGIVVHDRGVHLLANHSFAAMLGYEPEEVVGRSSFDFLAPESHELVRQRIQSGSEEPYEAVGLRKDGSRLDVEILGKAMPYQGRMVRVVAVRDISARKRIEAALRESEQRYRSLFGRVPVGLYRTTPDGRIVDANPALAEILGYPDPAALLAVKVSDLYVSDAERLREQSMLAADGVVRAFELRLRRHDGQTVWVEDSALAVRDADGRIVAYEGSLVDVTERKRIEQTQRVLAEASHAFAEVGLDVQGVLRTVTQRVSGTLGGLCIVFLLSDDGRWLQPVAVDHPDPRARAFMEQLLSTSPQRADEGISGQAVASGQSVVVSHADPAAVRSTMKAEYQPYFERYGITTAMATPLLVRGRVIGTISVARGPRGGIVPAPYGDPDRTLLEDLAGRAALAVENARLYQQAQEALRARDEFLSIAAHELKTPVTGIKGFAQVLLRFRERGRFDADRLDRALESINRSSDRLAALVDNLLDVSRIRLGRVALERSAVDLAELTRDVVARYRDQVGPSHRLEFDVPTGPCLVDLDAFRIEQVLVNLLDNAVKYSPEGGEVRTEVRCADDRAEITVRDEGIGLPAESVEAIFQPFGRAANAGTRSIPGMGLGLYICRNVVELHGGQITAESPGEGQGTTMRVWLPRRA